MGVACARLLGIHDAPAARLLEACSARRRQLCARSVEVADSKTAKSFRA